MLLAKVPSGNSSILRCRASGGLRDGFERSVLSGYALGAPSGSNVLTRLSEPKRLQESGAV